MHPDIISPPWQLRGNAFIMIYHFSGEFIRKHGFLEPYQSKAVKGWVGAVMMVDYQESPVGPYYELLFIPGIFKLRGRFCFTVSKAYVSSLQSVRNGQQHWGIPKEQADFSVLEQKDGSCNFTVGMGQKAFFRAKLQPGAISFPFSSRVLPFFRLGQEFGDTQFRTRPRVTGRAKLTFVQEVSSNPEYFPPIHQLNPLAVLYLRNFKMRFPQARTFFIRKNTI